MSPGRNPGKPRFFDEAGSFWTDGQARMARRTANYDRHLKAKDEWDRCPNCGSRTVKTDNSRDFRPTGSITSAAPAAEQASQIPNPSAPQYSAPPAPTGQTLWQKVIAFHGRHWRIIWAVIFAIAPFGSIGDETTYTGGTAANILKFIGILIACWFVAGFFFVLFMRHRNEQASNKHPQGG